MIEFCLLGGSDALVNPFAAAWRPCDLFFGFFFGSDDTEDSDHSDEVEPEYKNTVETPDETDESAQPLLTRTILEDGTRLLTSIGIEEEDDLSYGARAIFLLRGEGGDDLLHTAGANSTLFGGDGNNTLRAGPGNHSLYGNDGDDRIHTFGDRPGSDDIHDFLSGGEGDDFMDGEYGNDTYPGGPGDDLVEYGGNNDTIFMGAGDDELRGATAFNRNTFEETRLRTH